jgi:hypothetical protein
VAGFSAFAEAGHLRLDATGATSALFHLRATRGRSLTQVSVIEVELSLDNVTSDSNQLPFAWIGVTLDANLSAGWYVECWIGANAGINQGRQTCQVWDAGSLVYSTPDAPVRFGSLQVIRIESQPTTAAFRFFLNGAEIGAYLPSRAPILVHSDFYPSIGLFAQRQAKVSAVVNVIRISDW